MGVSRDNADISSGILDSAEDLKLQINGDEKVRLTADGALLIANTAVSESDSKLSVNGTIERPGFMTFGKNGTDIEQISGAVLAFKMGGSAGNTTERMRLTSEGSLVVGGTTTKHGETLFRSNAVGSTYTETTANTVEASFAVPSVPANSKVSVGRLLPAGNGSSGSFEITATANGNYQKFVVACRNAGGNWAIQQSEVERVILSGAVYDLFVDGGSGSSSRNVYLRNAEPNSIDFFPTIHVKVLSTTGSVKPGTFAITNI